MDWSPDTRGEGQRQFELLTGALNTYEKLEYNADSEEGESKPDHIVQIVLSTKAYTSSFVIGMFPMEYAFS